MALFNKLFFSSGKRKDLNASHSSNYISQFPFDPKQVRILLYRECDSSGRRLLFDSNAIQKVVLGDCPEMNKSSSEKISANLTNGSGRGKTANKKFKNFSNGFIEISNGVGYKHNRPSSTDITSIGEMVFGALAMSFRGTALKVHWLQAPARLLCSQVFLSPLHSNGGPLYYPSSTSSLSPRHSITSEQGSVDNFSMNSFSMPFSVCVKRSLNLSVEKTNPLDVPEMLLIETSSNSYTATYSTGDSGYSGTQDPWATVNSNSSYQYSTRSSIGSILSDPESYRKFSVDSSYGGPSSNSDGSLQRRISRNLWTSFENQNSVSDFVGFIGDNYQTATNGGSEGCVARYRRPSDTNETHSNPEIVRKRGASGDTLLPRQIPRRAKLGLAVCITFSESFETEMEQFCCEHIALFESMLCRLRATAENAYVNHKDFLQIMLHAWQSTSQWVVDLFTAPRLTGPVWLGITTRGNKNSKSLADRFMRELCWLLSLADTKDTNFFISTMLTAVLTHHLGWVTTVAAFNSKSKEHAAAIAVEQRAKLLEVSQKHPYNALWAQMGDLYGAIGNPPRLSRTIIYGKEKLALEKLLYVLTYFVRCGEVRRVTKREKFEKELVFDIINENDSGRANENVVPKKKFGLSRIGTYKQNLSELTMMTKTEVGQNKKNDIPNVLAFRDSRFVKQELRIGNYLMDTGIEKSSMGSSKKERIRLTVTTPENIEMPVDATLADTEEDNSESESGDGLAVEAIEIEPNKKSNFFWSQIQPEVSEGLSYADLEKLQIGAKLIQRKLEQKSHSYAEINGNLQGEGLKRSETNHKSLSDLITENSVGKSERLMWGIEPIKESISLEEEKHFEICQNLVEKERGISKGGGANGYGVVFVLGDNEALVNIKKSSDDLPAECDNDSKMQENLSSKCAHHHKKHSGVKFNFEEYPQIATNYMKNKNLDLSSYDFLEKQVKFDLPSTSTTGEFPARQELKSFFGESSSCKFCEKSAEANLYQTPSNATELEFETDDDNCYASGSKISRNSSTDDEKKSLRRGKFASGYVDNLKLLQLPVPGVKDDPEEDSAPGDMKVKAGFVPSLLVGVTDHYISDMVLQGTSESPGQWEAKLKEDLSLASHCASLVANPTENVAVVADMENWDVKVISSQTPTLPYTAATSSPVGMSQLVATMLETVYAMSVSGISGYECLSFLESKLQEMYLQSESLAAFLLATEFCSMNTVTTALNLAADDVPLLLSVASIHSPQVTRKYGISFR